MLCASLRAQMHMRKYSSGKLRSELQGSKSVKLTWEAKAPGVDEPRCAGGAGGSPQSCWVHKESRTTIMIVIFFLNSVHNSHCTRDDAFPGASGQLAGQLSTHKLKVLPGIVEGQTCCSCCCLQAPRSYIDLSQWHV